MAWYLMDCGKPINGFQIKERYGDDFEKAKKYQNIPRYVIYVVIDNTHSGIEKHRLSSAQKWCKKQGTVETFARANRKRVK